MAQATVSTITADNDNPTRDRLHYLKLALRCAEQAGRERDRGKRTQLSQLSLQLWHRARRAVS
jgi:hypothetical protein